MLRACGMVKLARGGGAGAPDKRKKSHSISTWVKVRILFFLLD